jgi:hypothetical protein
MKKALILVGVLALALGISYLVLHKSNSGNNKTEEKDPALLVNSKTLAFNRSFENVLNNYFNLMDAFLADDTTLISKAAQKLAIAVDSIRFDQFRADSSLLLTAISVAQSIPPEIQGLNGEKTMEQKKREFNMITQDLYSLILTVKYDGSIIYHMSCASAFADSTAGDWLSRTNTIVNPYLGKKNPNVKSGTSDCGEIKDSLHFRTGE